MVLVCLYGGNARSNRISTKWKSNKRSRVKPDQPSTQEWALDHAGTSDSSGTADSGDVTNYSSGTADSGDVTNYKQQQRHC